jgi:hypothetical protein
MSLQDRKLLKALFLKSVRFNLDRNASFRSGVRYKEAGVRMGSYYCPSVIGLVDGIMSEIESIEIVGKSVLRNPNTALSFSRSSPRFRY